MVMVSRGSNRRGSNRRGKSGGLAWKQGDMWENDNAFAKTKRRKYPQYTSAWGCIIMCKSNRPLIPANDHFWNEWPVGIAHNYTALLRSILGVLSKPPDFPCLFEPRGSCLVWLTSPHLEMWEPFYIQWSWNTCDGVSHIISEPPNYIEHHSFMLESQWKRVLLQQMYHPTQSLGHSGSSVGGNGSQSKLPGQDVCDIGWFDPEYFETKLRYNRFVIVQEALQWL